MSTPEIFFKDNLEKEPDQDQEIIIPDTELQIITSRSHGPGGQNVNKRETKVTLIWNISQSRVLSEDQKQKILLAFPNRIKNNNFIIHSQSTRSQEKNRQEAIERLQGFVNSALEPVKKRIPSQPYQTAIEKRLHEKKEQSEKKQSRQKIDLFEN